MGGRRLGAFERVCGLRTRLSPGTRAVLPVPTSTQLSVSLVIRLFVCLSLPVLPLLCPPSSLGPCPSPCPSLALSLASASFGTAPCPQGEQGRPHSPSLDGSSREACHLLPSQSPVLFWTSAPSSALSGPDSCPGLCSSVPPSGHGCLLPGVPFPQPQPWLPFTLASLMSPQPRITLGGWPPAGDWLKMDPCLGCFQNSLG